MSAETDLLPLPEATMKSYQTDSTMRTMTLHSYSESAMRDYARANLAELQREVEGLRAEVAKQSAYAKRTHDWNTELLANNERLAEALREILDSGSAIYTPAFQKARAALDQETTNG